MRDVKAAPLPQQNSILAMRLMAASVLVVALAGAAFSAHAQGHHGPGRGGADAEGMMMFGGSPRHLDRMLDGLNATDAQRAQIRQIATAAAADLEGQRDAGRGLREKGMQLFTAPTVDAAAAESLRQQMSAQREQASKRMLQAMLDVANVLTPEQRAKIGERMKERRAVMNDRMQRMQNERPPHGPRPAMQATPPQQPAPQK
jgi:Spy/CpxP family protein refolding chaperone